MRLGPLALLAIYSGSVQGAPLPLLKERIKGQYDAFNLDVTVGQHGRRVEQIILAVTITPKQGTQLTDLCHRVYRADHHLCDLVQEFNHLKTNWVRAGRAVQLPPFAEVLRALLPDDDLRPALEKMGGVVDAYVPAIEPLVKTAVDHLSSGSEPSGIPATPEVKALLAELAAHVQGARADLGRVPGLPKHAFHQLALMGGLFWQLAELGPDGNAYDVFLVHQHLALGFGYLRSWADGRRQGEDCAWRYADAPEALARACAQGLPLYERLRAIRQRVLAGEKMELRDADRAELRDVAAHLEGPAAAAVRALAGARGAWFDGPHEKLFRDVEKALYSSPSQAIKNDPSLR